MTFVRFAAAALAVAIPLSGAAAHHRPMVGGAYMYPRLTIVENASKASNLTTLVAALQAADLVDTLSSPGPFTVFAPTNDAFAKLPAGTVETLLQPQNRKRLAGVLTYHVLAGRLTAADILARVQAGGGHARLKTVAGGTVTARLSGKTLVLTDARGGRSAVTQADVGQKNGIVHVIDSVLLP